MNRRRSAAPRVPTVAWAALASLLAWWPAPVAAQQAPLPMPEPPAPRPARAQFLIDSIVVEGPARASTRRIVRSESRLEEGHLYDEEAIRLAMRRVKRLPFVLDARPTLRRGSLPGQYQLVIEVEETAAVVAGAMGSFDRDDAGGTLSLGLNQFLGSSSQVSASALVSDATHPSAQFRGGGRVAFSRYDVLGHGSRLRLEASITGFGAHQDQAVGGSLILPVGRDHSVGLGFGLERSSGEVRFAVPGSDELVSLGRSSGRRAGAFVEWVYDTTDDPFVAREGALLRASAGVNHRRIALEGLDPQRSTAGDSFMAASLTGPLAGRLSITAGASAGCSVFPATDCSLGMAGGLRFVQEGPRNRYRGFLEAQLSRSFVFFNELEGPFGRPGGVGLTVSAGLRARFAVVRLSFFHGFE